MQEVLERKVTEALEEGGVLDQLVEGLAVMEEEERKRMMQMHEAVEPRELRDRNIVAGKATIEKLVEERAFEKERNRKVRLIKEGIRRMYFQKDSGLGDILNFGMYEGCRFGDVYNCHPTYGEWATDQLKPKMWKLKSGKGASEGGETGGGEYYCALGGHGGRSDRRKKGRSGQSGEKTGGVQKWKQRD